MAATADIAAGMSPDESPTFPDPSRFEQAYATVRHDPSIQFDLPQRVVKPPAPPPQWLVDLFKRLGGFFDWSAPVWHILFWVFLAALLVILVIALVPSLRESVLAWWRRRRAGDAVAEPRQWAPEQTVARRLLEEADALAAAGRYDDAVHLILFRSIEDIEKWRGDIVRPSLTSRDIARADALPDQARTLFARIVAAVERSLFARRPLGIDDWTQARADYAGFALRGA